MKNGIKPINQIEIKTYPRIHLSLIGLNDAGYRTNGGIGFSIESPPMTIHSEPNEFFSISDTRRKSLNYRETKRIIELLEEAYFNLKLSKRIKISIIGDAGSHLGFGSGTAIRLAILESLLIINQHNYNPDLLVQLSKRGGTSGIGINTYFNGGFIFDAGRKYLSENYFLPSSANEQHKLSRPLVISSLKMPNWGIGICIPNDLNSLSEDDEKKFFEKVCPISDSGVFEILYHSVYGVTASVIENDYTNFCQSIKNLQKSEWKSSERNLYGKRLLEIETNLFNCGADAVGLSSMGPLLYFLSHDLGDVVEGISKIDPMLTVFITNPINSGREISYG